MGKILVFWEDNWLGNAPLSQQYPSLFNIAGRKHVSVAHVLESNPLQISFRMTLTPNKLVLWLELAERLMHVHLTNDNNAFVWSLTSSDTFTVKSYYLDLLEDKMKYLRKYI
jgi:hypothetical protein